MMRGLSLFGLGAGLMYFGDPDRGRSRRALIRNQFQSGLRQLDDAIEVTVRDLGNRASGLVAEVRQTFHGAEVADDRVITERVRATLGRYVSHPRAIEVMARDGRVRLRGPILAAEVGDLVAAVAGVRGVRSVDHELEVHENPEGIAALQGGRVRSGVRSELCQQTWSPTMRLIVGATAGALAFKAARHSVLTRLALGGLGLALATRAAQHLAAAGPWPSIGDRDQNRSEPDIAFENPILLAQSS